MAALTCCAARPLPPAGELVLDAAAPIVAVRIAGVALRLRVDPSQWGSIELAPEAAARLPVAFEPGGDAEVGRVTLPGRVAHAPLAIEGRTLPVQLSTHDHAPAADVDGLIGPDLLPYAAIVWRRAGAPAETARIVLPLALDDAIGLSAPAPAPLDRLRLRVSLLLPVSQATAAAGALLLARIGGRFDGPRRDAPGPFGIDRPVRPVALARGVLLAGFRFTRIDVRVADFRGDETLPADPAAPGEILVAGRTRGQHGEYWLTLARDRLDRCGEIAYRAAPRTLTLACAFD